MKFFIVDCFAEEKYQGNELLVIIEDKTLDEEEQQKIAREINFSETVFINPSKSPNDGYNVRIWTPNTGEVPFAGHPTLGAAYIINKYIMKEKNSQVLLNEKVGQIMVNISDDIITMKQKTPKFGRLLSKDEIAPLFEIDIEQIRNDFPIQWVNTGLEAVIIPLKSMEALSSLKVNTREFKKYIENHPECNCNHLFFFDRDNMFFSARCLMEDFVEDPATGSANGCMAAYLLKHNYFRKNEISYTVFQGEKINRKSVINVQASLLNEEWTINVGGRCQLVAMGEWL